ncbi:MAG: 4-alpha-glucanotransferase, partial [Pyrinomonadaceae bacterium]
MAHETFKRASTWELRHAFEDFCRLHGWWLEDYAMFRALRNVYDGATWNKWEPKIVRREPEALDSAHSRLHDEIEEQKFTQFLFYKQWLCLKEHAHSHQIKIIGDIPIFVAHDSSDVWCNPHFFKLNDTGNPLVVAGVPPDYFSSNGQLWGNPIYDWQRMQEDGFKWWIARVQATLAQVDIIRLDHFRGFAACWEVPAGEETAVSGRWVKAPGLELFTAVKNAIGELPFIAEDLGIITPDVVEMREKFGLPGMRVLQFAFAGDTASHDLPHNYDTNCVVYTGTHDNDTTLGWFTSVAGEGSTRSEEEIRHEREFCLAYLDSAGRAIHWDFIRAVLASVAHTAIIPLQDLLGLSREARMNLPAS